MYLHCAVDEIKHNNYFAEEYESGARFSGTIGILYGAGTKPEKIKILLLHCSRFFIIEHLEKKKYNKF